MPGLFSFILIPLIVTNIIHMVIVKKEYFAFLTKAISAPLFGLNKTWRGFFIVPLLNGFLAILYNNLITICESSQGVFITGVLLGLAYVLFELPNSFLKRRLGIVAGESPDQNKAWFMLMDKTDSSFGVSLFATFIFSLSFPQSVLLFFISAAVHASFSILLVLLNLKKGF